ncbi:hypothetical protein SAMN02799631_04287 [Methylobacterium sp. 174MFSha1.1]|uniref:hypothetical protein n=1 Tax=Methylobacterium sp. 174MFSha1.1 TaxID=1502749 RepID=UPI0008E6F03F|nr:hypothetical protein [Methylobacterium sp. 174MFSha1.1]SFV05576.1 hypothetical protein SAMN02799631_04287 [Methylobacterium sp. 174MFSha1.1]
MGSETWPVPVGSLKLVALAIMVHDGPSRSGTTPQEATLQVDLEEVAPGEFIISVGWREKKLGSLYLRGDRVEAEAFLAAARQRIVVSITGDAPGDVDRQVQRELIDLGLNLQQPRG